MNSMLHFYNKTLNRDIFLIPIILLISVFVSKIIVGGKGLILILLLISLFLIVIFNKNPIIAIISILINEYILFNAFSFNPFIAIGSYNIFLNDGISVILWIIVLLNINQIKGLLKSKTFKLYIFFSFFILFNIVRGIILYGQTGVVVARGYILFLPITFFVATIRFSDVDKIKLYRFFIITAILLILITILRVLNIIPLIEEHFYSNNWRTTRPLRRGSGFFLVLTLFGIITTLSHKNGKNLLLYILAAFITLIIISLRIRTMWILTILGFLYIIFFNFIKISRKSIFIILSIIFILLFSLVKYGLIDFSLLGNKINTAYTQAMSTESSTLLWRINSVKVYLKNMSFLNFLIGTPFGTKIVFPKGMLAAGLHNGFIQILFFGGIVPFICFILLNINILKRLFKIIKKESDVFRKNFIKIVFISLLIYQVGLLAWSPDTLYFILLGISIYIINYSKNMKINF